MPAPGELLGVLDASAPAIAFDLPWPWGGERFDLRDVGRLTYITGPLGSGKTRLARAIAAHLPGGVFLGLDRLEADGSAALARPASDPALAARVEAVTGSLVEDGACRSPALLALLVGLDADAPVVIDMVEQGLDQVTQDALGTYLRQRGRQGGPVFLMTRSSAILDLTALGGRRGDPLLFRHSQPDDAGRAYPGSAGYESVATCLAPPDVRARTEGVIAWRPPQVARRRRAGATSADSDSTGARTCPVDAERVEQNQNTEEGMSDYTIDYLEFPSADNGKTGTSSARRSGGPSSTTATPMTRSSGRASASESMPIRTTGARRRSR